MRALSVFGDHFGWSNNYADYANYVGVLRAVRPIGETSILAEQCNARRQETIALPTFEEAILEKIKMGAPSAWTSLSYTLR
eukprot:4373514-Amphidinium_carterae.1